MNIEKIKNEIETLKNMTGTGQILITPDTSEEAIREAIKNKNQLVVIEIKNFEGVTLSKNMNLEKVLYPNCHSVKEIMKEKLTRIAAEHREGERCRM